MDLPVLLAAAALGALLLLDNNAVFQGMLSRPLVTGALFGWLLCDSPVPLLAGTMLELIWANVIPLGEQRRPSTTVLGTLCAIVLALWPGGWAGREPQAVLAICFLVILFAIPVSFFAKEAVGVLRRRATALNARFAAAIDRGQFQRLFWLNLAPLPLHWALYFAVLAASGALYLRLLPLLFAALTPASVYGLAFSALTLPFLGLAVFIRLFDGSQLKRWLLAGAGLALAQRLLLPQLPLLVALVVLLATGLIYIMARRGRVEQVVRAVRTVPRSAAAPGVTAAVVLPVTGLWCRSLLVQAAWNSERMLNLGLTMMMAPVVTRIHGTGPAGRAALHKYLDHFNTHPYFISLLVGVFSRLEATGGGDAARVAAVKREDERLLGPLAAAGGSFFWEGLRPLWGLIGIAWVQLASAELRWWGPLLAVIGYNAAQLHMRWYGLRTGWRDGETAIREYLRGFRERVGMVHRVGLLLLGGLMVFLPDALLRAAAPQAGMLSSTVTQFAWGLGVWALVAVFLLALFKRLGVTRILFASAFVSLLVAWGGELWAC